MKRILAHSVVIVIFLLSLMAPVAGAPAPAKIDKTTSDLAIAAPSRTADLRAVIYPCAFEGRVTDEETGDPIQGAAVTFVREDDGRAWTDTTSTTGSCRVELPEGSYSYIATHKKYVMESSSPALHLRRSHLKTKSERDAGPFNASHDGDPARGPDRGLTIPPPSHRLLRSCPLPAAGWGVASLSFQVGDRPEGDWRGEI